MFSGTLRSTTVVLILLSLCLRGDEELDTLIRATIAGGGVIPHIHKSLINKTSKKKKAA